MKNAFVITMLCATLLSGAAFADATQADINADVNAIHKDDAAIAKQNDNIAVNRAEKEAAEENGDVVDQASQSVQIGANKTVRVEKNAEKSIDKKILDSDTKSRTNLR